MLQLYIPTKVHLCETWDEAAEELNFSAGDLLLVSASSKQYWKKQYPFVKILALDSEYTHVCSSRLYSELLRQVPEGTKRILGLGDSSILNYAKLLHNDYFCNNRQIPLILITSMCDAGSEMLTRVTIQDTGSGEFSNILTTSADAIYLYLSPLRSDDLYKMIAGSVNSLIYSSETFIHEEATSHTMLFSREALRLLISSYRKIVFQNKDMDAGLCRSFLLAGNYTGIAREQIKESQLQTLYEKLSPDIQNNYHIRLLIFIHLFRKQVFAAPTGRIQEFLSYMSSLLDCRKSNVYPELLNLVTCVLPPDESGGLPLHLHEIERLIGSC